MIHDVLQKLSEKLGYDTQTIWKSTLSGTSSTGLGIYITKISNFNWQFELNFVSLFWGAISCIILTILSLAVSDLYKYIKKKIFANRG